MLLFVNACWREGSRTERLARMWLENYDGEATEIRLAEMDIRPLDADRLATYNRCVAAASYEDEMFDLAHQFAAADEVLIAAPMWNYSIPALLHDYLELVCTQGVTFDLDESGAYGSLTNTKRLVYVSTAGGPAVDPLDDHAFGYVRTLAERFWFVPTIEQVAAWGLDGPDADVDALLAQAIRG